MRWHLLHDADQVEAIQGDGRGPERRVGDGIATPGSSEDPGEPAVDGVARRRTRVVVLVGVALLLAAAALDATIISVALPTIRNDLGGGAAFIQWVASIYFLVAAIVLVPAGRMVDLVGAKRVLVVGGLVYVLGASIAAVAVSPPMLVVGRAVQGGATGIASPAALVLLSAVFGARRRGTAIGVLGTLLAVASATGPIVGGALTDSVGWRAIFVIHVVMAALGTALAMRAPATSARSDHVDLDGWGIATWAAAIVLFQLAILHWGSLGGALGPLLLVVTVGFAALLLRTERRRSDPLLDLSLLRIPAVAAATIARFVAAFSFFGNLYYLTLFLQSDAGFSAFQTGLILLPASLIGVLASPFVGRAVDRVGSPIVLELGVAALAGGLFVMAVVDENSSVILHIAPGLALNGLGFAMVSVSAKSAPLEAVPSELQGRVTSLVSVVAKAASGLGVTVATGFFNVYTSAGIDNGISDYQLTGSAAMRSFIASNLGSTDLRGHLSPAQVSAVGFSDVEQAVGVISDSFAFSMSLTMASLAVIVVLGAVTVGLLLRRTSVRT